MKGSVRTMNATVPCVPRPYREMALRTRVLRLIVAIVWALPVIGAGASHAGEATGTEMALGAADAPVTMVEYFSFSCPHCARFYKENFPRLKRDYIDDGKVRWVFRDFPLNMAALTAARLTRCVEPGRYFEIVDLFWRRWDDWIDVPDPTATLFGYLRDAGVVDTVLDRCENDASLEEQVLRSYLEGSRDHGVDSTPTFFINGKKYVGMASYARLTAILDALLDK